MGEQPGNGLGIHSPVNAKHQQHPAVLRRKVIGIGGPGVSQTSPPALIAVEGKYPSIGNPAGNDHNHAACHDIPNGVVLRAAHYRSRART